MRERILNDLKAAMKNQNKEVLSVLRMVKGAMQLEEINKKRELNDDEVIGIIAKQIKTRKESIVEFEKGNRSDLIEQTKKEIEILESYMPEQLSEEEINKAIDEAFSKINPTGMSDVGKIMGYLTPILKGKADLGIVNKMVRDRLNN
ncbi:MAG: GatB/YqeY domain-containing protein [Mollicutes bacterium]|nr:GatB/YqeY domain-containing protein [Mollicutes bacterium]